jgi:hypothetical protein
MSSDEEEDPEIDDGVDNDNDPYLPNSTPWVQALTLLLAQEHPDATITVLRHIDYQELQLPTAEDLLRIMHPSDHAGSLKRFAVRVDSTSSDYYMVKEVDIQFGANEINIGKVLRSIDLGGAFIPAIGGVQATGTDTSKSYFVAVPWKVGTRPLSSFIQNQLPQMLGLSTAASKSPSCC